MTVTYSGVMERHVLSSPAAFIVLMGSMYGGCGKHFHITMLKVYLKWEKNIKVD